MQLDYNARTSAFILRLPRNDAHEIQDLMNNHGFDFSTTGSTPNEAILFTREPYAACHFAPIGTPTALGQLAPYLTAIQASWAPSSGRHIACPADKELWGFQRASSDYTLERLARGTHVLVADQPGLGKTPIAIGVANEIQAKRVLVICPANIRIQWVKRIREWTTLRWPYTVHPILNSRHGVHPDAHWTVVSYDLARTEAIGTALARGSYDLLVLDEAHYLKETSSWRTRAVFGGGEKITFEPLAERSRAVIALTGTPLPNRPRECYTLARALHFDSIDWMSEDRFRERFNPSMKMEQRDPETGRVIKTWVDERSGRHAELQARLRTNFMVRHLKRDVMPQLQLPVYDLIQLEETKAVRQALQAESLLEIDPENLEGADAETLGHIAVVRRLMGLALAPQIAKYVDMLIDGGEEKLVVFGHHIEVLDILQRAWERHGVVRIDGRTGSRKQQLVDEFIKSPKCQVILGNLISLGTGTDGLQEVAWHALIAEPDWVPGNNEQAFDRLDRGGQKRRVQGDIFVAPNSFAEKVLASALRKLGTTHKALDKRLSI